MASSRGAKQGEKDVQLPAKSRTGVSRVATSAAPDADDVRTQAGASECPSPAKQTFKQGR